MSTTLKQPATPVTTYEPVIGLEVHVQLLTASKIFCGCSTKFGAPPNTNVCPVCLGLPGALPVLNKKTVDFAVRAAMALNCHINETSIFARKNYFYPDLPKGYQISQYVKPLAEHGFMEIKIAGTTKKIGITRLHMEEDAGKSMHEGFPDSGEKSYIDLNRSGVPLSEIVSEPDLLPLLVDAKWQAEVRSELPELPEALRARLIKEYGITEQDAGVLTATRARSDQFEKAAKAAKNPKRVANLVQGELMGRLKAKGIELEQSPISMAGVAMSADLVEAGTISGKMMKDIYELALERGKDFSVVYEEEGRPQQSTDTGALEKIIDEVIAANPKQLEQYRGA